ncbi:MAG: AsmA-like C-terminal region-containing protein, partial [Peristeroidobacter soli]
VRAAGVHEGTIAGTGSFTPGSDGSADLDLKLDLSNVRASLASEGLLPGDVPPLGLGLDLRIHGSSPRQMASGANGHVLLTQGAGKIRSGLLNAIGGGVVEQLTQKLNPFSREDRFMKLDCTVARADIVDGQVTVKPLVVQSEKVTISAHGHIDLHTEKLLIDFNTRPRKGIGVSPGMFTNPLIRLEGTLASPRIGVGAKGLASGAVAAATGGVTVVAGGLLDRMVGEKDICQKTLAAATAPAAR